LPVDNKNRQSQDLMPADFLPTEDKEALFLCLPELIAISETGCPWMFAGFWQ
jgi:hypothetical protein